MASHANADPPSRSPHANPPCRTLGFPDAEIHLLKADLVNRIQGVITAQKLTKVAAAKRMDLSRPDVSRLPFGQFRDVPVKGLMHLLMRLGCDVDIAVRTRA